MSQTMGVAAISISESLPEGELMGRELSSRAKPRRRRCADLLIGWLILLATVPAALTQRNGVEPQGTKLPTAVPPRVSQAHRFLANRGFLSRADDSRPVRSASVELRPRAAATGQTAAWHPLGPVGVVTPGYGLVTGRISSIALDPGDPTGNRLFVGTTGGGLWVSQNAATSDLSKVVFSPLTDSVAALNGVLDASISIGAISVQPGGTGVILAGTGDPNDALDSYYGGGILRSTDGGTSWSLIQATSDLAWGFSGEGFAGFAWSTSNPQLVVAAVSQSWEGFLVGAPKPNFSYEGLYYSTDSGATWSLSRITDLNGQDVQGPRDLYTQPDGNGATSVVWNPVRGIFVAAVRFHGYYQSTDGVNWTRLATQPGAALTTGRCPTNSTLVGSADCPMFRGALAVNPITGDTFAWSVDVNDQDQGIWQDICAAISGSCTNPTVSFTKQWGTAALESSTWLGPATIFNGDYDLTLAAIPSNQDTILLAGGNDLWRCSLAMGCTWRNTTNAFTCMSAGVGGYQHALEWSGGNPLEVFVGNDSGLWRSMDGIGESGTVCAGDDASHFQNLNGSLGSLAEVESMSALGNTPFTMMAGLGANGTAGVKSTTGATLDWPQVLSGEGSVVVIDPANASNWYVNNGPGVSIHLCAKAGACTPADFGSSPIISNANVSNDGLTMTSPSPFLVDPTDPSQLLIATCRLWRGPANGVGWSNANAVSSMFDGNVTKSYCSGNSLVRSIAALALPAGGEVVYVGLYGKLDGGATLAGHVLSASMDAKGNWSAWQDLTLNPVLNLSDAMNMYGSDISSIFVDPSDPSGKTVYVTIAEMPQTSNRVQTVYSSSDGGAHWNSIRSNLGKTPANSLVIDPGDANTAYVATDIGVYETQSLSTCANAGANCWTAFGTGLPTAPVTALSASPVMGSAGVLAAATFGRGVWQIPMLTTSLHLTSLTAVPGSLSFPKQSYGTTSTAQTVTVTNTGLYAFVPGAISASGDFSETDNCAAPVVAPGASCTINVTFKPTQAGTRNGAVKISGNLSGASVTVQLTGIGDSPGTVFLSPVSIDFGAVKVGATSAAASATAENTNPFAVPISSLTVTGPFALASNACGTTSLAANSDCQITVTFQPGAAGAATGALTMVDSIGTQVVQLKGTGAKPPTDTLSATALVFPATIVGLTSAAQTVTLTNSGDVSLTGITASTSGAFQVNGNCTTILVANSSCALNVVFAPTATGSAKGTLTVSDEISVSQTVSLTGTGLAPPAFSVTPASLVFGGQQVGSASASQRLTVTNSGGAAMANVGFQITGSSAGSFSTGATTCGSTLASLGSCTVEVIFKPAASGGAAAVLTVTSSTLGVKALDLALNGTGLSAAGLNVSPSQLSFAAQAIGQPSAAQTVTITDSGGVAATGLTFTVSGPFSLTQNNCGTTLAAGASCTTGVIFTPGSKGALTGALTVASTSVATQATVALSGIGGLNGAVVMAPSVVTFATTGVGTYSSAVSVTISNASTGVVLTDLVVTASVGFKLASSSCTGLLSPGANCAVAVEFAPTAAGAQNGTLSVASSTLAAVATVPLSGMGYDFQVSSSGPASLTISSGQTATFALSLAPSAGVSAPFTYACGSLPAYAGCIFNPASQTIAADATGTLAVQMSTSQTQSASVRQETPFPWRLPMLAIGLFALPLAWRRRFWGRYLGWFLGIAFLGAGISGCSSSGGGSGGGTPTPTTHSTPAGTYSVPVTVTSNGVQHAVTLTLVVD